MAFRSSPLLAIKSTGVAQPAFGSWVTAVSPAAGFAGPSGVALTLTLGTASASTTPAASAYDAQMFAAGEPVYLIDPNGANFEECRVANIPSPASSNTLVLGPKTIAQPPGIPGNWVFTEKPHAAGAIGTGTYIIPKQMLNNILVVLEDGGTGTWLYIGKSCLFTSTYLRLYKLGKTVAGVQPSYYNAGMFSPGNPFDLSEIYVSGTEGDTFTTVMTIA